MNNEIKTIESQKLYDELHKIYHELGMHFDHSNTKFQIITLENDKEGIYTPFINNTIFYDLLFKDIIDDIGIYNDGVYYKVVYAKYIDSEYGDRIRSANKEKFKNFSKKNMLIINTNSILAFLKFNQLENADFINDFEFNKNTNNYIKIFDNEEDRLQYIVSIEDWKRVFLVPADILYNNITGEMVI